MQVVELSTWLSHGRIPRSSDCITRPVRGDDLVVFVSHRWWSGESDVPHPDIADGSNLKYKILCRGLHAVIAMQKLKSKEVERLVVWMDFTCVDQDDAELQKQGIQSLIA